MGISEQEQLKLDLWKEEKKYLIKAEENYVEKNNIFETNSIFLNLSKDPIIIKGMKLSINFRRVLGLSFSWPKTFTLGEMTKDNPFELGFKREIRLHLSIYYPFDDEKWYEITCQKVYKEGYIEDGSFHIEKLKNDIANNLNKLENENIRITIWTTLGLHDFYCNNVNNFIKCFHFTRI